MHEILTSSAFHRVFRARLAAIARTDAVTVAELVLVLANAITVHDEELVSLIRTRARQLGLMNPYSHGDQHILNYILDVDDPFSLIHHRTTSAGWKITFNELRALRPPRDSRAAIHVNHRRFDPAAFNFNNVPGERFWSGQFQHRHINLFFNKFPIEAYHSTIVPSPEDEQPQYLEPHDHALIWDLHAVLSHHQPHLIIGYNGHGAGESINHLHFQLMPEATGLKLLQPGAADEYPIPVSVFRDSDRAWRHIHRLQTDNKAFNLIYAPGRMYVVERTYSGSHQTPSWTTGFAWWELAGGILTVSEAAYKTLTDNQIAAVFSDMTPRNY